MPTTQTKNTMGKIDENPNLMDMLYQRILEESSHKPEQVRYQVKVSLEETFSHILNELRQIEDI